LARTPENQAKWNSRTAHCTCSSSVLCWRGRLIGSDVFYSFIGSISDFPAENTATGPNWAKRPDALLRTIALADRNKDQADSKEEEPADKEPNRDFGKGPSGNQKDRRIDTSRPTKMKSYTKIFRLDMARAVSPDVARTSPAQSCQAGYRSFCHRSSQRQAS